MSFGQLHWRILFSLISQKISHECYGFWFLGCRYMHLRNEHFYVSLPNRTWQHLFETFPSFDQKHLLVSQLKFAMSMHKNEKNE